MNRILITHADLDGVGCAFILARCLPVDNIKFVSKYSELHDLVVSINEVEEPQEIWITDLGIHRKTAKLLANSKHDINLVDHHGTSKELTDYPWAVIDTSVCATKKLYDILSLKFNIQDYLPLVELINDYDLYGNGNGPSPEASQLNSLQILLGPYLMLKRLHENPKTKLTATESKFIAADLYKQEQYIHNTHDPIECENFRVVCCERHVNKVGNIILMDNPEVEFVAIVNYNRGLVSLRGRGNINLGALAKEFNGGGHPKSAGFEMPITMMADLSPNYICEVIKDGYSRLLHGGGTESLPGNS